MSTGETMKIIREGHNYVVTDGTRRYLFTSFEEARIFLGEDGNKDAQGNLYRMSAAVKNEAEDIYTIGR